VLSNLQDPTCCIFIRRWTNVGWMKGMCLCVHPSYICALPWGRVYGLISCMFKTKFNGIYCTTDFIKCCEPKQNPFAYFHSADAAWGTLEKSHKPGQRLFFIVWNKLYKREGKNCSLHVKLFTNISTFSTLAACNLAWNYQFCITYLLICRSGTYSNELQTFVRTYNIYHTNSRQVIVNYKQRDRESTSGIACEHPIQWWWWWWWQ